ncbi:MAG: DUF4381 domain-containing protein [Legionellales bacterium]|nr:DUF4381 domain-containing protein [Legionellales bacterium]
MNNAGPLLSGVLQQLKDIKQPPPVSWWPLAPGWYILLGLVMIIAVIGAYYAYRHFKKWHRKRLVLSQIQALKLWFAEHADTQQVASQLSILLKQVVFVSYPPQEVAGLHGEDWLLFLDRVSRSSKYSQGCGRLLMTAPYATQTDENLDDLFQLVKQTIKRCL